jgi:hypothetical protein
MGKARRRSRNQVVFYVATISGWKWSYSFGLNRGNKKLFPEQFSEYRHLEINGTMLRPSKLNDRFFEATLMPSYHYLEEHREKLQPPTAVGSLRTDKSRVQALLSLPTDALAPILSALSADHLKYFVITSERTRYGNAPVAYYDIRPELAEDDLPGEGE